MKTRTTIRRKLVFALLVVLVPLIALQAITFERWRRVRVETILQGRASAAYAVSAAFDRYVLDIVHQNDVMEAVMVSQGDRIDKNQLRALLSGLKEPHGRLLVYGVTDANGTVIASDPASAEGIQLGDRDYFRRLKTGADWTISNMLMGKERHRPTFVVANSVTGGMEKFRGIVFAAVDVRDLKSVFSTNLRAGEVLLLDKTGRLVFDSWTHDIRWSTRDLSGNQAVMKALAGSPQTVEDFQYPLVRSELMGSLVPVEATGWVAGSFLPKKAAMIPVRKWSAVVTATGASAAIVSLILVWLLGTLVAGPIRRLTKATEDFATGVASPPINLKTGDELELLGRSFNSMKEQIAERETRLAELAQSCAVAFSAAEVRAAELEAVLESIPVGVIIAEGSDGKVVRANRAATQIYGRDVVLGVPIAEYVASLHLLRPDGTPLPAKELPLSRAIAENRLVTDEEVIVQRPDGGLVTMLAVASPIRHEDGTVTGAVAVFQDISERKRLEERDRTIAEALQDNLMPELPRECKGLIVASRYIAALDEARVGGDFVDIFEVTPDRVAVVIGDVSGKGLAAAMEVAMTKYYIRAYAIEYPDSPGRVLTKVNEAVLRNGSNDRFVTAFLAIVEVGPKLLHYANAGHEPQLIKRGSDGTMEELWPTGMPLGVDPATIANGASTPLSSDDALVLYTDGVTEARSPEGNMLTIDGLKGILSASNARTAQSMNASIFESIMKYTSGQLRDDFALLVVAGR